MWSCPRCGEEYSDNRSGQYQCISCGEVVNVEGTGPFSWSNAFVFVVIALIAFKAGPYLWEEGQEMFSEAGGNSVIQSFGFNSFDDDITACYAHFPEENWDTIRQYEFEYDGWIWEFEMEFDSNLYGCLASPDIRNDYGRFDYKQYVTAEFDDESMEDFVQGFREAQDEYGYTDRQIAEMLLAFVQSLTYATDDVTSPYDEWPRFPEETLFVQGGDCEDTAILYTSLIKAMGYDAALVAVPGHMAAAIPVERTYEGGYTEGNTFWAYVETTGEGWQVGQIPDPYQNQKAQLIHL